MNPAVCKLTPFQRDMLERLQFYVILLAVTLTTVNVSSTKKIILSHNLKPKIFQLSHNLPFMLQKSNNDKMD